ncbi:MAG: hypothetical protein WA208_01095 [Thermoanaerobaculia bacterium]
MATPEEHEQHTERRVVYETVSSASTKSSAVTFIVIAIIALALIIWLATKIM